ncbi:MAG: flagellar hook-associated protein FlgK [Caldimicrobium sp.]|nr:flagellar hook-associated protein FlgK [Caldimicrobium sp.]
MAGLSSALNIAKNALLNFQTATSVISHNVANVNNPAFSRQKAVETTYPPSPSPVGSFGAGSKIEKIIRYFDAFLERNINLKRMDLGLFSASESGLRILESLFNETQDSGLSKILREFWSSWQNLSNYPENLSARTQVIETGKLIVEAFQAKFQGMKDLETQIGLKLKEIVDKINRLSSQIAELNLQVIARESGGRTANDLRDQRDRIVGELSQLAGLQYFETKEGAYNIVLGKGFNLVNVGYSWKLEISGTDVYWVGSQGERVPLTGKEVTNGELGGWLKLLEQLSDSYNYEYVSSTSALYLGGRPLGERDTFQDLGISTGTIVFQGRDHFGREVQGNFTITGDKTLREFLNEIERAYSYTVRAYLKEGRLFIEDAFRGSGRLEFQILSAPPQLSWGTFDDPAYQRRVLELNLAGKLKLFGEELIKAVNELHTQGVGLEFFKGELEGAYQATRYIKELPYFLELNRSGFFYIWVRNDKGQLNPVRVDLHLHEDSTIEDLANQINRALSEAGYETGSNYQIRVIVRGGKLVFQAKEGWAYAFSNDTSGILLSTGINLFFVGLDPAEFQVNPLLVRKPELIASGKMDVYALRSSEAFFGSFRSSHPLFNTDINFQIDRLYVRPVDERGEVFPYPPLSIYEGLTTTNAIDGDLIITFKDAQGNPTGGPLIIRAGTSFKEFPEILNGEGGIRAYYERGILRLELVTSRAPAEAVFFEVNYNGTGLNPLVMWNETLKAYEIPIDYDDPNDPADTFDTLGDILRKLNHLPFFRAYLDESQRMVLRLEPNQSKVFGFEIGERYVGANPLSSDSFVTFLKEQNILVPSLRWQGAKEISYLSGLEPLVRPTLYLGKSTIDPSTSTSYRVKFFDSQGNLVASSLVAPSSNLEGLITNFDSVSGLRAQMLGDNFYIWLDRSEVGAPSGANYFVIEIEEDGNSPYEGTWNLIRTQTGVEALKLGEISAYLFDEKGRALDTKESEDGVIDPFRIELYSGGSLFQVLRTINSVENAPFALSARLDREGKLIIETTGLYKTKSFVLEDTRPQPESNFDSLPLIEVKLTKDYLRYNQRSNQYFYLSDYPVPSPNLSFGSQTITLTLYTPEGNSLTTSFSFNNPTLNNILTWLNGLDLNGNGILDIEASFDPWGRLKINLKDGNFQYFSMESDGQSQNFISFLLAKLSRKERASEGLIHRLKPYELKRGDNRIAQAIADSALETREALNLSNLENYYASITGEVGTATKAVNESKTFLQDLLRQLSAIKDSISGVSLDEEMANLIKYQQAFTATAKILSTVEDMFEALITAKR